MKAAAQRRVADEKAAKLARQIQVEIPRFSSPGQAAQFVLETVTRRAAQFGRLADQFGDDVFYTGKDGQERVRAAFEQELHWLSQMTRVLGLAVMAGADAASAERQRAEMSARALADSASAMRIIVTRAVRAAAASGPEGADAILDEFDGHIREMSERRA